MLPPIAIIAISAFLLFGGIGVARHYGLGELVDEAAGTVGDHIEELRERLRGLYLTRGVPLVRQYAWYTSGALWMGAIIALILCVSEQPWHRAWLGFVPAAVAAVAVVHMLSIVTKSRPSEVSILATASATLRYMVAFGVVTLVTAQIARSTALAYLGNLFIVGAAVMLWAYVGICMTALAKIVGAGESIADATRHVAWGIITQNDQILQRVFSRETNFGDEQSYLPWGKRSVQKLVAAFIPTMVFGMLHPSSTFFFGAHIAGFVVALCFFLLDSAGIDTYERRQRAAMTFVIVAYGFLAVRLLSLFFPGLEQAFVLQQENFEAWLVGIALGKRDVMLPGWKQGFLAFIVGSIGLWKMLPKADSGFKTFRKMVAGLFAALLAFGTVGIVAAIWMKNGGDSVPFSLPSAKADEGNKKDAATSTYMPWPWRYSTVSAPSSSPASTTPVVQPTVTPLAPQITPVAPTATISAPPPVKKLVTPPKPIAATGSVDDAIDQLNAKFN